MTTILSQQRIGMTSLSKRRQPKLLTEVFELNLHQAEVDFVIPDLAGDLRLGIDPFLLYKSRSEPYRQAHIDLVKVFNDAIQHYASGNSDEAANLLDFPEVNELNFGYRKGSGSGSGMGAHLRGLLLRTLGESPALVSRGVRHVEEMQLVSLGIGADRVSDMAANLLKGFLIDYTQRQAETYGIPLTKDVPINHVFDYVDRDWRDGYFDLPINPIHPKQQAILLVPRRLVRVLPWINFEDYQRSEFGLFLRARRTSKTRTGKHAAAPTKADIVAITRAEVERIDHYIDRKEDDARRADPELLVSATPNLRQECDALIDELKSLGTGHGDAHRYQDLLLRVNNTLFEPDLIEGRKEVRTEHGTERRDILFTNDSDKPFWEYVRQQYGSLTVLFECKNKGAIDFDDINQVAAYLGDAVGYLGIILTRNDMPNEVRLKAIAWFNKGVPRRVVIALSDSDMIRMLQMRGVGNNPLEVLRGRYQEFMQRVQ